jgi:hypothetical protein
MADYEALKDQWSDIEETEGLRLSWNTFPSSRMVGHYGQLAIEWNANRRIGGIASCWYGVFKIDARIY